ncbi:uncharacterized protein LOC144749981 [Ciona intestinalis]
MIRCELYFMSLVLILCSCSVNPYTILLITVIIDKIKEMLQLGQVSLTLAKAKELLEDSTLSVYDQPQVKPKGGEGYLFKATDRKYKSEYTCDQYRFISTGCNNKDKEIYKRYYSIKDPAGKGKQTINSFQRHVYSLRISEFSHTEIPLYLIHYIGDETIHKDSTHGNAKTNTGLFFSTSKRAMDNIAKKVKIEPAKKAYAEYQIEMSKIADQTRLPTDRPRNRKQCANVKYIQNRDALLTNDEIFSTYELMTQTGSFIRKFLIGPDLVVHIAEPEMIKLTSDIIKVSAQHKDLKQVISYDTTFCMGDFYVSVLVCRNVMLDKDPIFPFAFMIHDRKFARYHRDFFHDILKAIGLDKAVNVPFVTDRERGITKAFQATFPKLVNVYCTNHVIRDVGFWVKQFGTTDDVKVLKDDIERLINVVDEATFHEILRVLYTTWTEKFKEYFNKNLKHDLLHHCCDFITRKFPAFVQGAVTNNISESMNNVLKTSVSHKELPLDVLLMAFMQMQKVYLNEFSRALARYGDYQLKPRFNDLEVHHSKVHLGSISKLEDIIKEILQERRVSKSVEKGNLYRSSQKFMAKQCINNEMMGFAPGTGTFTVLSYDKKRVHCVQNFPKPAVCSCPSSGKCYHIFAVEMGLKENITVDKHTYSLSQMRKRMRGREGRSGRKKPRAKDYDYTVIPAPDAREPKDRTHITTSTPKKIPITSTITKDDTLLDATLSTMPDTSLQAANISAIEMDDMHYHTDNVETYPWLMNKHSNVIPSESCRKWIQEVSKPLRKSPRKKQFLKNNKLTSASCLPGMIATEPIFRLKEMNLNNALFMSQLKTKADGQYVIHRHAPDPKKTRNKCCASLVGGGFIWTASREKFQQWAWELILVAATH